MVEIETWKGSKKVTAKTDDELLRSSEVRVLTRPGLDATSI